MFEKILPFWSLFRKGEALADCSKSGDRAAIAGSVVAFLAAALGIAASFGYTLPVDDQMLQAVGYLVASGIVAWLNGWHVAANPAVGLPARADPAAIVRPDAPDASLPPTASGGNDRSSNPTRNGEPPAPPLFTG